MKVWLIQNIISPYRIPLFKAISEIEGVDFKLILLSKGIRFLPQWNVDYEEMPFRAERVRGFVFYTGYENQKCMNPLLLVKVLREKPEVIICSGFSFATLIALIYSLLFHGKYIIWNEGTRYTEADRSKLRVLTRKIMARFSSGFVDAGTLSRQYLESLLPEYHSKPFVTSYNCVDNRKFRIEPSDTGKQVRELKVKYPEQNLLYVGQLVERKGIHELLEAYGEVIRASGRRIGLILIGDGPLAEHIRWFRKRNHLPDIYLEGFVENDRLPHYYAFCDLFVLPSLHDPNPLVVFEALAAGIPILCSFRAGNAVDFIVDGKNGYIVDPANTGDIADKVLEILRWERKEEIKSFSNELVRKANYSDSAKAFVDACILALST